MFQIEQKLCKGTINVLLWHIVVLNCRVCLVWPYVASYGLVVAFHCHGIVRSQIRILPKVLSLTAQCSKGVTEPIFTFSHFWLLLCI